MKKLFDFYLDEQGEYDTLLFMLGGGDMDASIDRADMYGIPSDIAAKIRPGKKCPALATFLKSRYAEFGAELKQSLKFHNAFWAKNGAAYRKRFESILGHEMPTYSVMLSVQTGGISNWHGTYISINAFDYLRPFKSEHMIVTLVWESMLSQAFQDIRKKYDADEIGDRDVWGASELTAVAIYQTDFSVSDWPIGYRKLEPHRAAVKNLYRKRANFESYLDKAVRYFKKHPLDKAGKKCSR
jgi:hypothetical protein